LILAVFVLAVSTAAAQTPPRPGVPPQNAWGYVEAAWTLLKGLGRTMEPKDRIELLCSAVIGGTTVTIGAGVLASSET
jgi:hypothetical protein